MDPAWTNRSGAVSLPQSIYGYLGVAMATVGGVQGELGGGLIGGREALHSHPHPLHVRRQLCATATYQRR